MGGIHKVHVMPPVGSTFTHDFKGKLVSMTVVKQNDKVVYRVSGKNYSSPTAAANSVTGASINGWAFWHMEN
jgi:hypothetical protein